MLHDIKVGDKIELKKKHPCGENIFEVMRVGMDVKIKCTGCGKEVWLLRRDLNKRIKKILNL